MRARLDPGGSTMAVDISARRLSRRRLLRGSGLALAGLAGSALLAACTPPSQMEPPKPAAPAATAKPAEAAKPAESKPAETKPAAPAAQPAATTAPAAAAPAKPAAAGEVTLKAMYWSASPEDHKVFEDVWGDFEKRNPGIKIAFDDVSSNEFAETLLTRIVGGQPPDIVKLHPSWVLNFIQAKQLNDLTDMMKGDKSVFIPAQLEFWSDKERNYGVPYYSGS